MGKNTLKCMFVAIAAFIAGFFASQIANKGIIDAQHEALEQADKVMGYNDLWDEDGSDSMVEYMRLKWEADSAYYSVY